MSEEAIADIILENQSLKSELGHYKNELEHKQWIIQKLKYQIYGPQSEKVSTDEPEQFIFNELEKEAANIEPEQTELIADKKSFSTLRVWWLRSNRPWTGAYNCPASRLAS